MKMYTLLSVVFIVVLSACKPVNQNEPAVVAEPIRPDSPPCTMTLGMDAWEPYQYMTVGNVPTGLDVELVKSVAELMGCKLNVVQGSWLELLALLKEGDVDFVLGASQTTERKEFAYFSEPYRQELFQLYVRKNDADLPVADLKSFLTAGHKVGIVNEYYYGDEVAELYADETLRPRFVGAIISELNMARLLDEEIDGLLEDSFVGASILRRKGLDKYIQPHSISLGSSDVFVMFSKASVAEEQVLHFNNALQQLRNNGAYNSLLEKYSN